MNRDTRRCTCRFGKVEGLKGHEAGCPMLLPPPMVPRDPLRYANPVAIVTGGPLDQPSEHERAMNLHGLLAADPAADITGMEDWRQPRDAHGGINNAPPQTLAEAGLPPALIAWHEELREQAATITQAPDLPLRLALAVVPPTPKQTLCAQLVLIEQRLRSFLQHRAVLSQIGIQRIAEDLNAARAAFERDDT